MTTNRLTDATIRSAKPKATPYKLSDGGGLHLLVTSAGGRLWRLAYRFEAKQKTLALGAFPTVGLADARAGREAAKKALHEGRDPVVVKAIRRHASPTDELLTFETVAKSWFQARRSRWADAYAARIWSRVEQDLIARFGDVPVGELESADVLRALRRIESRGAVEMARRVKNYAADIFRFARAARLMTGDPTEDLAHALASPGPAKRRTALKARDLPEFIERLAGYDGDRRTRLAITFVLLTFVRTKELRLARWDQLENLRGDNPTWRIPPENMKMGNEHLVPLSRQALQVLDQLRAGDVATAEIFGAETKSGVISENTMLYALYRMGYHGRATIHGFRGTASTVLNEHGFNRDWIERQLAHVDQDQVRAAYNVAEWMPERRRMMQWWADFLEERGLVTAA